MIAFHVERTTDVGDTVFCPIRFRGGGAMTLLTLFMPDRARRNRA